MPIGDNFDVSEDSDKSDKTYSVNKDDGREIDRNAVPNEIKKFAYNQKGVQMWKHDPKTQKDYADEPIVRVFIDVIAKAVSRADWHIINQDTGEAESEIEKRIDNLHPRSTFREVREKIASEIERTGSCFIIINRYEETDEIAEILIPKSETMFVVTDDDGFVEGYVKKRKKDTHSVIDKEDVIQINWGSRAGEHYGVSPTWQSKETIETISELYEKEITDLREGEQSGIISLKDTRMNGQEIQDFGQEINANKGERHELSVVDGDIKYVNFNSNYKDMMILDRYEFHIQALSSAFRVSPSFVGFDIGSGGGIGQGQAREQDRLNQVESVNIILNQIQDKLNRQLVKPEFGEEYKLTFDTSSDEDEREVDYYQKLGDAIQSLQSAGIELMVEDDSIIIPDGQELTDGQVEEMAKQRPVIDGLSGDGEKVEEIIEEGGDPSKNEPETNLTDRKKELMEVTNSDTFKEAVKKIDDIADTKTEQIEIAQDKMSGTMSPNTWMNWHEIIESND